MTGAPTDLEARVREGLSELADSVEVSRDAWSRIGHRAPRLRRRRRVARVLVPALGIATVTGLVVAAIVTSAGDGPGTEIATSRAGTVSEARFVLGTVPEGYTEIAPEEGVTDDEILCDRWHLDGAEPVCDALLGSTHAGYKATSREEYVTVETFHGDTRVIFEEREEQAGSTPARVRGHEALHLSYPPDTEPFGINEQVVWNEGPGVAVMVSYAYRRGERPSDPLDLLALAEGVVGGPLSERLRYVVARGPVPSSLTDSITAEVEWVVVTGLGDPRDGCVFTQLGLRRDDPFSAEFLPDCVAVPPADAIEIIDETADWVVATSQQEELPTLLVGVVRGDVASVEIEAAGTATPVELLDSPADLGYRFFGTAVGPEDAVVLRARDAAGRVLGKIEYQAPLS